mmetsp:Transcript_93546/g.227269  ORF Transcript_93546/g.227269 Transcript_93546/m.227269 type:complete len:260 (-) Transcript_93546:276-1055(-)
MPSRARFTNSLIFRTAAYRGSDRRSMSSSFCSSSNSARLSSVASGFSQKLPMYTRTTSGVFTTLPRLHMSAPYTRINCCVVTRSALLSTTRTLSSCPLSALMARLNSSEMSSLWASKSSRIISARSANHCTTSTKSYDRPMRCFSPDSTPGVSTKNTFSSTSQLATEHSNLFRKAVPNLVRPRNGRSAWTAAALPGITRSMGPPMTATNRSVVGSGPMRWPGKSRPSMYRMNDVLPTEYWPRSSTIGLASKSELPMSGE